MRSETTVLQFFTCKIEILYLVWFLVFKCGIYEKLGLIVRIGEEMRKLEVCTAGLNQYMIKTSFFFLIFVGKSIEQKIT